MVWLIANSIAQWYFCMSNTHDTFYFYCYFVSISFCFFSLLFDSFRTVNSLMCWLSMCDVLVCIFGLVARCLFGVEKWVWSRVSVCVFNLSVSELASENIGLNSPPFNLTERSLLRWKHHASADPNCQCVLVSRWVKTISWKAWQKAADTRTYISN